MGNNERCKGAFIKTSVYYQGFILKKEIQLTLILLIKGLFFCQLIFSLVSAEIIQVASLIRLLASVTEVKIINDNPKSWIIEQHSKRAHY